MKEPRHGEPLTFGSVYLAPRDQHLSIVDSTFRLERGPKEHFTRPAIDALFRSAAASQGPRVVGVLLTGGGRDGASGLTAIKQAGGLIIVQHPGDAQSPAMPRYAIERCDPDLVLPLAEIPLTIMAAMRGQPLGTSIDDEFR